MLLYKQNDKTKQLQQINTGNNVISLSADSIQEMQTLNTFQLS